MPHFVIDRAVDLWTRRRPVRDPDPIASAVRAVADLTPVPADPRWAHMVAAALDDLNAAQQHHGPHHRRTLTVALTVAAGLRPASSALAAIYYRAVAADGSAPRALTHWDTLDLFTAWHALGAAHRIDHTAPLLVRDLIRIRGYLHPSTIATCVTWAHHAPTHPRATRLATYAIRQLHHVPTPTTRASLAALARLATTRPAGCGTARTTINRGHRIDDVEVDHP
ncbi:hypothetical protein KBX50_12465 [Micromonospora sp. C51]|uniref:hypothetical protein n=1 Tax=Micromonospora sp. C51 TaxID=2824879 RepID=UPI001B38ABC5|nr:hypothetical protein [Micromonospora sp. C51]MBQ1049270.1 hypothetical protein [Micromonospora sp. C51]